jgi:hypothetical protein
MVNTGLELMPILLTGLKVSVACLMNAGELGTGAWR